MANSEGAAKRLGTERGCGMNRVVDTKSGTKRNVK